MTEQKWRSDMLRFKKSLAVIEGMELIDVMIADLEREKRQAKEKDRLRERPSGLRNWLKCLLLLSYHKMAVRGKGAAQDA